MWDEDTVTSMTGSERTSAIREEFAKGQALNARGRAGCERGGCCHHARSTRVRKGLQFHEKVSAQDDNFSSVCVETLSPAKELT